MAQKATKSLATRNAAALKRLHLASLGVNLTFILLRLLLWRSSVTFRTIVSYALISGLALAVEIFFEFNSRPKHDAAGNITRAGDDLEARGLTEYLFDVMYWTWGTVVVATFLGDRSWWMWAAVPVYSIYAAYKAFGGIKESLGALSAAGSEGGSGTGAQSNRQKKMEKRGGQRVQYR
jgi:SRP-independent targeting protein 2/TMEM208